MNIGAAVLAVLLALVMIQTTVRKVIRHESSVRLRDDLQVPASLWQGVAGLEAAAALGLLAGIVLPWLGVAAALGVVLLMIGAVLAHLRVGMTGRALVAPAMVMVVALATVAAGLSVA